jgi:hypothetical protein
VTEAISLQATLVFGLLRYYRNDKKPRSPHGTRPLAMTRTLLAKKQIFFQKIHSFLK